MEHFQDSCKDPISWIQQNTFYLEFSEGWALYAENPLISKYTDTYRDDPLTKYGMLKWQVNKVTNNRRVQMYSNELLLAYYIHGSIA